MIKCEGFIFYFECLYECVIISISNCILSLINIYNITFLLFKLVNPESALRMETSILPDRPLVEWDRHLLILLWIKELVHYN